MEVDQAGFETAMEEQRARGRAATSFSTSLGQKISVKDKVEFCGYDQLSNQAQVIAVFDSEGEPLSSLDAANDSGVVFKSNGFLRGKRWAGWRRGCLGMRLWSVYRDRHPNQRRPLAYWSAFSRID